MGKAKEVVQEEEWGKVVVMDTAAQIGPEETGQVVVMGSHGAESAARHVARFIPFGVILNDAGKGKGNAGISGLSVLESMDILGATVDCMTGRIGEGSDNYSSGVISAVNDKAKASGVRVGMSVIDACSVMLQAKKSARRLYITEVVYESEKGRIILADSISFLNESHRGSVIVTGSHCSHTTFEWTKDLSLKGVLQNDAGIGKENQGISALPLYDRAGIPAAAIDCMTAMIGNARDAWETGSISSANQVALQLGVHNGMNVQDAARKFLYSKSVEESK
jgi:uncharacterized protein YunC (DUF1805 family)